MDNRRIKIGTLLGIIASTLIILFGIFFTPDFVAMNLSPDGIIEPSTIDKINSIRMGAAITGPLMLLISIVIMVAPHLLYRIVNWLRSSNTQTHTVEPTSIYASDTKKSIESKFQQTANPKNFLNSVKPLCIGISASILACTGFMAFNFIALTVPINSIQKSLRADFASNPKILNKSGHPFNDCLLMAMTIDRPVDLLEAAISPNRIYGAQLGKRQDICRGLRDLANYGVLNPAIHISVPYHQYWCGMRSVLALSLPIMGISGILTALQILWFLSFAIALFISVKRLSLDHDKTYNIPNQAGSILIILICLALFSQISEKSKAFDAAPTDIIFLWILIIAMTKKTDWLNDWRLPAGLGFIGALVAYFEMLHGAIPLFFACIFFLMGSLHEESESFTQMMGEAFLASCVFLIGVATAFFVKIFLVMVFIDHSFFSKFFDLLNYRITGNAREYDIKTLASRFKGYHVTVFIVLKSFFLDAGVITWGVRIVGQVVMVLTGIIHAIGLFTMLTSKHLAIRRRLQLLISSSAFVIIWWILFMAHSANHTHMILRLWAWPIAMAILILQQNFKLIFSNRVVR